MCSFFSNTLSFPKRKLTSKILEDSSQVYGRSHTDAILGQTPFDVAQHASHGEDDPGLGGPGRLCRLLLSPSAGHRAEIASLLGSAAKQPGSIKKADFKVSKPSNKLQTQVKMADLEKRTAQTWSGSRKPVLRYLKFKQQTINLVAFTSLSENICLALIKVDITVKWQKDKTQCFHSLQDARYCCHVCFAGVTWLYLCPRR